MNPGDVGTLLIAAVVAVIAGTSLSITWDTRGRHSSRPAGSFAGHINRRMVRISMIVLSVLSSAITAGLWLNQQTRIYPTWEELLQSSAVGGHDDSRAAAPAWASTSTDAKSAVGSDQPVAEGQDPAGSRMERITIDGPASGLNLVPHHRGLPLPDTETVTRHRVHRPREGAEGRDVSQR